MDWVSYTLDFVYWNFLDLLHIIVVIDIGIASVERSQIGWKPILGVFKLHEI